MLIKIAERIRLPAPRRIEPGGASRRTALKVALGVGYAAAALPCGADRDQDTSAEGLKAGRHATR